ncbi:hypothetical protein [Candidatus Electronema sp. JM]|uniref:hypothetical protein n=1 Tax=Candidatus Electronema sp. JM TaxID=3401571 RepID=UPI003AA89BF3
MPEEKNSYNISSISSSSINSINCCGDVSILSPENVSIAVSLIGAAVGAGTVAVKAMQLWIDERKSRKVKIKYKDIEIEVSGVVSEKELSRQLNLFKKIEEEIEKEKVEIVLVDGNKSNRLKLI